MGFSDTVMSGHVSATDMAAVAIANSIWLPIILTIYGLIMALSAIVSQLAGANKFNHIAEEVYQTAWIALSLGLSLIIIFICFAPIVFESSSIEIQLKTLIFDYLFYIMWGAPAYCLYLVLRNYCEGLSNSKPTMVISILALLINIPTNYVFIYGELGFPALGGAGCGLATALVYWAMFIFTSIYCFYTPYLKTSFLFKRIYWPNWIKIKSIFALGLPIALSLLFEVSLFSIVAILLIPFGAEIVASHQIALNFTGLIFMIPLSISIAVTIKVGFAIGQKNYQQAKEYSHSAIILGLMIALITALFILLFRYQIGHLYSKDLQVIELAANLMFLAMLYQFSDTVQVISAGALRGYKDTRSILLITFISYWLVGFSIGLILAKTNWITAPLGAYGFWIGFIFGLSTAAVLLSWRLRVIQQRILLNK